MRPRLTAHQREMVEANLGIAGAVAARYRSRARDASSYEDLRSISFLALCDAALGFDPARGFGFSAYASRCCHNAIIRELRDNRGLIRTGSKAEDRDRVRSAWIGPDGLGDFINSHPSIDPVYQAELRELRDRIADLPARERWAIERSLEGWKDREIGRVLGLTRAMASFIRATARRRLRGDDLP